MIRPDQLDEGLGSDWLIAECYGAGSPSETMFKGRLIAYCDAPTVTVVTSSGEKRSWRADLSRLRPKTEAEIWDEALRLGMQIAQEGGDWPANPFANNNVQPEPVGSSLGLAESAGRPRPFLAGTDGQPHLDRFGGGK